MQQYSRTQIKAPKFQIKEWDYYLVVGDDCAVAFTLSDDGYVGLQTVSLLDFSGEPNIRRQECWHNFKEQWEVADFLQKKS